ncbi:MAG: sigma 54-interacting transcriptional regulator [Silvibacterium sp.]|nr:sigma 54-interacting transcriptional regulator [Silvibacterium sp.]
MQRRLGCFESADGGTLFLEEVGDVRVIAATNRDLPRPSPKASFAGTSSIA